jgi:transposase
MGMKARCSGWYNDQPDRNSNTGATGMNTLPVYVGLDYHQDSVQVCVLDRAGGVLTNRSCVNDWQAIASLASQHGVVAGAAIEACTGAADLAEELMRRSGWLVDLAHPGFVNRMRQNPDKHDWGDARLLADLERIGYLPRVWLAPEEIRELRRLVNYRQQIVNERRNIKLRVGAMLRDQRQIYHQGKAWTLRWLSWLSSVQLSKQGRWIIDRQLRRMDWIRQELVVVEDRLAKLTQSDPVVAALQKQKGIGPVTAWVMRAHIGRFDRFRSGKQLSRFCGLSPRNASSGQRQADSGLIKAGNQDLRTTVIEAAHRLIRYDPNWRQRADRMQGKPRCVVIAAMANRWIRWLFHQMQTCRLVA